MGFLEVNLSEPTSLLRPIKYPRTWLALDIQSSAPSITRHTPQEMTADELIASMRPREAKDMPRGIQLYEGRPTLAEADCAPHLRSTGESFQELERWTKTVSG